MLIEQNTEEAMAQSKLKQKQTEKGKQNRSKFQPWKGLPNSLFLSMPLSTSVLSYLLFSELFSFLLLPPSLFFSSSTYSLYLPVDSFLFLQSRSLTLLIIPGFPTDEPDHFFKILLLTIPFLSISPFSHSV